MYWSCSFTRKNQRIVHFGCFFTLAGGRGLKTALFGRMLVTKHGLWLAINRCGSTDLIASSKTLLRLRCVNAEHSRYFTALISLATATACSYWIGAIFFCCKALRVFSSSRRSNFVPTRMMGTPGAWCSISGYHCVLLGNCLLWGTREAESPWLWRCQKMPDWRVRNKSEIHRFEGRRVGGVDRNLPVQRYPKVRGW